jgi:hypothetical protein
MLLEESISNKFRLILSISNKYCSKLIIMQSKRWHISTIFSLLALLVIVYSITYSGRFIIDDEHILASRSISLTFDEQINNTRVIGNSRVFALSQLPDAAMNIEPLQTVLGVPFVILASLLNVGQVQCLFLMNIWITALTAVILFLIAIIKGYSKGVALIVALLFGFCTIAFPYSRTFFRDPLAMFFLATSWMFAAAILQQSNRVGNGKKRLLLWIGLFISLGAGVLTKNTILIAFPVIFLELLIGNLRGNLYSEIVKMIKRAWKLGLIILGCLGLFGIIWFMVTPSIPSLARFTPSYYGYLLKFFFTTPRPHILEALTGPFISPGKSIFIFSPVLLLSIWSLVFRFRSSWSAWLYMILLIVFQGLFYDDEWAGHINWGLRYILPAIPGIMVTIAPLIQRLVLSWKGLVGLILFAGISLFIQLLGVLTPISNYFQEMFTSNPPVSEFSTEWGINHQIIFWCIQWIKSGKPLDLALARNDYNSYISVAIGVIVLILVFLSLYQYRFHKLAYVSVIVIVNVSILVLILNVNDPLYMRNRKDYHDSQQFITEEYLVGDLVLIKSYGSPIWDYWMNWTQPGIQWTSLPYFFPAPEKIKEFQNTNNPDVAMANSSLTILSRNIRSGMRVWLVVPSDSPGAELGIEKQWLANRSNKEICRLFKGKNGFTELCMFIIR